MLQHIRPALSTFLTFTILTGVLYPAFVTLIAQTVLPHKANGSLIRHQDKTIGSQLIGQPFAKPKYFWGRVSATSPFPYNAAASSGSNLGPSNPVLSAAVQDRIGALQQYEIPEGPVPVDLVTSSASGLDPHISPAAAVYQIPRVAKEREVSADKLNELIKTHTQGRQFGVFGELRVNVLELNIALDQLQSTVN